ncbi:MAG: PQQ-dependent sugar dehydrogenase [Rhodothermales bacterium]
MNHRFAALLLLALAGVAPAFSQTAVERAFPALSFDRPVDFQHAGDGSNRIFVVEQHQGRVRVFPDDQAATDAGVFLDIGDKLSRENEEGLLGLAFHPDYATNGYFFVYYSTPNPRRSVIARYTVGADPNVADPESERIIMEIGQPYGNHNGGQLLFGPDGYLYIGLGDGGDGGDPDENARNPRTLLGSILRIDVNASTEAEPYGIPADNPFAGHAEFRPEIFAYGVRNPWRMSFDPVTGWLWAGDVGQGRREEVNIIEKGNHYGWDLMEGTLDFEPDSSVPPETLTPPIWEYGHDVGQSITGGHVYRGTRNPELVGRYIFGDHVSRQIWALSYDGTAPAVVTPLLQAPFNIPAFGTSEAGELYICGFDGGIYRFVATLGVPVEPEVRPVAFALDPIYPNPFSEQVTIPFRIEETATVSLAVYDMLGREVRLLRYTVLPAGSHVEAWDGLDAAGQRVADGAYLVRLRVDGAAIESRVTIRR